jgi:hypothetical protein
MSRPSVTAVMVTGHDPRRRPLALLTARAFPRQTYAGAELLIVNQGAEPLLAEPIPRVREVTDGAGLVVGALRNLAWQYATGDLMTCWDDDDVHHPDRIAIQVNRFTGYPVLFQNELFLHLGTADAFTFYRRCGYENSLLWPRQCESRYPERRRGSDSLFRGSLIREFRGVTKIDNPPSLYVRLFHGRNIWHEDHFFGQPRRQAANPRNRDVRIAPPTPDEQRLLDELLPAYRDAIQ